MADLPPSYETATNSDAASQQGSARNGIPALRRRSMEDEARPLPPGWIRQFDAKAEHQFFVDTRADPPRSIWHHPYDDEQYLATLSPEERDHLTRLNHSISLKDIEAEVSDDDGDHAASSRRHPGASGADEKRGGGSGSAAAGTHDGPASAAGSSAAAAAAAAGSHQQPHGLHALGRKLKDRVTHTTHEQRAAARQQREQQERAAYAAHLAARNALVRAMETGQPQFLGKDQHGRDVYVEPPHGPAMTMPPGGNGAGYYGYNPYAQGPYADPNARFLRPQGPYSRPYGPGYGGGYGLPLMGGLLGGALLGGLLF